MSSTLVIILWIIAALHALFYIGEAFLWKRPALSQALLPKINPGSRLDRAAEARALDVLFVNQAVYNLMIALGAVWAATSGAVTLATFICLFVLVAGLTLALTSKLRIGAVIQALPGLIGLVLILG
ncbi:DUF1304 domain-containing protein [Pseudooceanicola sp.]|uniref:DUF1304 domain-containing protein n=1 Tax=Pseudooceanicola sp. TaxID=1914328 RepID=UPI002628B6DA|nr:DUF1304 domain-containing protein [Pseudooceanicola sp.]